MTLLAIRHYERPELETKQTNKNKLTMMGIFSLGFASCLANKYCSIPGFANPGNLIMKINAVSLDAFPQKFSKCHHVSLIPQL